MKKSVLLTVLLIFAWSFGSISVKAQNDREVEIDKKVTIVHDDEVGPFCNIPGLTDEQRENMDKLRMKHQQEVRLIRANIQEKRAHLNTLRLAENPDMQQINKTIDEIASMQADIMKKREAHRQAIRSGLNEEQKEWFDSRPFNKGGNWGPNGGNGMGPDHRPQCCCGNGMGPGFRDKECSGPRAGRGPVRQSRVRHIEEDDED